jgi:shikimate dehydrogenase
VDPARAPALAVSPTVRLAPLQALVENRLPAEVAGGLIVLIGDHPSTYSRSPALWTAALRRLALPASYFALDVRPARLADVVAFLRATPGCWGANVTVPYKTAIVPLLDDVDPAAAVIGAVNTIVRRHDGRLVGTNTDGVGLICALIDPDHGEPLVETLYGAEVLLIGGGGAARGAAVGLARLLGPGRLRVVNRTAGAAAAVANLAAQAGGRATLAVTEEDLDGVLPSVDVVVNASLRGQAGIRAVASGWTSLEPYSALAPAAPAVLPPGPDAEFLTAWRAASAADIQANHARSRERVRRLRPGAAVFDMVYTPEETVTVQHAREAGLRAAAGRGMMIGQAVEALARHICARAIGARGLDAEAARAESARAMADAWPAPRGAG